MNAFYPVESPWNQTYGEYNGKNYAKKPREQIALRSLRSEIDLLRRFGGQRFHSSKDGNELSRELMAFLKIGGRVI
jgi:hypothetical protein